MRPMTLRGRVTTLLLQWSALFVVAVAIVAALLYLDERRNQANEQLLLARTSARYLDAALASQFQALQRITRGRSVDPELLTRLRTFRFQSFFRDGVQVVDAAATSLLTDPANTGPVPAAYLRRREAVTPLFDFESDTGPRLAIVQPFHSSGTEYFVVSEMRVADSPLPEILGELLPAGRFHVVVVDSNGRVIADSEHSTHGQVHSESDDLIAAIAAREPTILEDVACEYCAASGAPDRHVLAFAPLRMAPWGVGIERCTRRFPGEGMRLGYSLAVMLAVLVLTGIVLSRALSRSVVRPLSELSEQAEKIRAGDLGVALEVEGDEEIRSLATTLDDARQRLAATLEELGALNEELESKVRERTRESRRLVRRLLRAGEEERRRIARELHDEISQLLTVVQISIEGIDAPEAHVEKARSVLAKAQKEVHRIIFDLRPSLLDDLGLAAAIRWYAKNYLVSSDVQVDLEIQEGLRLSPEIEITVFRIYQEIVTNILRHSGADYASVELYAARDRLVLTVEDNGVGFDPQSKTRGAGLVGLRERASLVGGTLRVDSEPGEGTSVRLEVPFGS